MKHTQENISYFFYTGALLHIQPCFWCAISMIAILMRTLVIF